MSYILTRNRRVFLKTESKEEAFDEFEKEKAYLKLEINSIVKTNQELDTKKKVRLSKKNGNNIELIEEYSIVEIIRESLRDRKNGKSNT